jgi:hypothetical protein
VVKYLYRYEKDEKGAPKKDTEGKIIYEKDKNGELIPNVFINDFALGIFFRGTFLIFLITIELIFFNT